MSNRNNFSRAGGRNYTDPPPSSRYNSKYHQRGGGRNNRPDHDRRPTGGDDVDSLMLPFKRHLTTDGNSMPTPLMPKRTVKQTGGGRRPRPLIHPSTDNQIGWWRITIQKAGTMGKDRVMSTLKAHCTRQFQHYHYFIDRSSQDGIFFVNSQQDADMLKRANGKIEVQQLDTLRIMVCRTKVPVASLDADIKPHFKEYLLNRRFNHQTFQLDLSNLADDEELSTLGIYPQFNKLAFMRDVVDIINKDIHMTRQLDLGSNNIINLHEFRNLHLDTLMQLSLASNQLKNVDDFDFLKQFPQLTHLLIKNNPIISSNSKRNDDTISNIRQKLPQLKRIDDIELPPTIRFLTDIESTKLPKSLPHCVPQNMQEFLAKFIDEFYRLFDTRGRGELHACYHDSCMLSFCIASCEGSLVPTRLYKYGALIYESRNLKRIDDNKRVTLLRHGKTAVLDFLRIKFPLTKHEGNSFHVDVMSTANNRAMFTVNGLYREVDQGSNGPVRCFQRTFTCAQTPAGVLIIADHIMLNNATDAQVLNLTRAETAPSQTISNQTGSNTDVDLQNQMILRFAQQSGMNMDFAKLCLTENHWNYDKAAEVFLDLKNQNKIPSAAFIKP